jgi:RNA polymerase sigma-70 factor (ECF subfamily)
MAAGSHLRPVPANADGVAAPPLPRPTTEQMVARAKAGEMSAWSRLYQDHYERIYRHVRALTGEHSISEELTQETFVQALLKIGSFDGRSSLSTWLHGVAINTVRNHWRSQKSTAKAHAKLEVVKALDGRADAPDGEIHQKQRVKALYAALETLPDHLRVAFVLRDLEGLSPEDAAEQVGISTGNLAVRATRARQRIRKQLVEWGVLSAAEGEGS